MLNYYGLEQQGSPSQPFHTRAELLCKISAISVTLAAEHHTTMAGDLVPTASPHSSVLCLFCPSP